MAPTGYCNFEITNIDYSTKVMQTHLVFDEWTSSIFRELPTSTIVGTIEESLFSYNYSVIIRQNDPDWELLGTNSENVSHWRLEKDLYFSVTQTSVFPFEQLKVILYFASNRTHYFSVNTMPNYSSKADATDITMNQFPTDIGAGTFYTDISSHGFHQFSKIEITTELSDVTKFAASMMYLIFGIFFSLFLLLTLRRDKFTLSDSVNIMTSVLVFLPILLFTFRTFIAPEYLTLVDLIGIMLIAVYGALLCFELYKKTRKKNVEFLDY